MKPAPFDYAAPRELPEALALLADEERDAKVLAGGQSLVPMLSMRLARPGLLVDITRIPGLDRIRTDADGSVRIGAAVRQAEAAAHPEVVRRLPLLAAAIGHIGHPQIRNRGTVCGSLVHHDPAAELPAAALALDAELVVQGPRGERRIPAARFFLATFQVDLEPDEILTEAVFPAPPADRPAPGWSFRELARRRGDFAAVGAAVLLGRADGITTDARIVLCGAAPTPLRVPEAERALTGRAFDGDALGAARDAAAAVLEPAGDIHATAEWRREAALVLLHRACTEARERCS